MKRITNDKTCYACGKIIHKSLIGYHPDTLRPYCLYTENCNNNHPGIKMLPADYEIVEEHIKESFSEELSDGILRMFSRTSSFRPALSHIMHILNMQEKYGTKSVNDTVLKIIESHARANGNDDRIPEKVQIQKKRKRNNFLSEGAKEKRQQDTEERKEEKQEEEAEDIIL